MTNRSLLAAALGGLALTYLPLASAPAMAQPAAVQTMLPKLIGPIPTTAASRPFLGADPQQLAAVGYVEEEYFLSGMANVYDWTGPDHQVKVVAGPGRYVTRILVRRPKDPARFSGNIEVTVLNASLSADLGGPIDAGRMARQGDVWVGITTKSVSAQALTHFDPVRYAPLDWSNPAPVASRCAMPSIIPEYMMGPPGTFAAMAKAGLQGSSSATEDGLVWDMLGQLGLLLKSGEREKILPGFGPPKLYMTGVSQSGLYIRTWVAGFHDLYRTPDGKPVYDGYLDVVGPAMARINQCAADVPLDDPRQKLDTPDVPFISISSEGEMWQARYTRQPDAFSAGGGYVAYEVAGASHQPAEVPGLPRDGSQVASPADMAKAGVKPFGAQAGPSPIPEGYRLNDFVWTPALRGAYANLQAWVREGTRPPEAVPIDLNADHEVVRDRYGNALGGLRMPYIEAATAAHVGYLTAGGFGGVMGKTKPFAPETLKALYADHAAYVFQFDLATDRLLDAHLILPDDAAAMKAAAAAAKIPE